MLSENNNQTEIAEVYFLETLVRVLERIDVYDGRKNNNLQINLKGKDIGATVSVSDEFKRNIIKILKFMELAGEEIGLFVSVGTSEISVGSSFG